MFEQDYLMRMLMRFLEALTTARVREREEKNPLAAADLLEEAISNATDMDGSILLSLAPESMAGILQVSGVDPKVMQYIAHSLLLESEYLTEGGNTELAQVRANQARALAEAYDIDLPDDPSNFAELEYLADVDSRDDTGADAGGYDDDASDDDMPDIDLGNLDMSLLGIR